MPDAATAHDDDVVTKLSRRSVTETVARFTEILAAKGVRLFTTIDQRAEALRVGLELRETTLVVFGSPTAGTPVMVAAPLSALDLPLKIVVWADGTQTKVSYVSPRALAARYQLSPELEGHLSAIDGLTDALVGD
ncbi:MAG TPA: DUF302 domain-containing protein [Acidimicrobiales bacterium]|nr:DUF302 domain-containing protein [Acidimicrobiales bacterium]